MSSVLRHLHDPSGVPNRAFGPADEHPYRRLTGDWIRVAVAVGLLAGSMARHGLPTQAETAFVSFWASLPSGLHGFFELLSRLGALWAVLLLGAAALVARRWRLALELVTAGGAAWLVARLAAFVDAGDPIGTAIEHVFETSRQPTYPVVPLAVMSAVVLTASPFLTRPVRRIGPVVLALTTLGTFYRDDAGFNAVVAALVVGWGSAAALHLAFGSPAGRPTTRQVEGALAELGVEAANVRLAPTQQRGYTVMLADGPDGTPLHVRVYGRDAADTQLVVKIWRFFAYKDSGPTLTFTRLQQVEHEALCQIVAADAGVHVPDVVAAGVAGPSAALVVTRRPDVDRLADLTAERADDAVVLALWRDVALLRARRVAHGTLDLAHVVMLDGAPTIVDFSRASISAPQQRLDRDVANLLVSTALLIGSDRALAAARSGIGDDAVAAALPLLTKPALSRATRAGLRHEKKLLDELQEKVSTATDVAVLAPIELRRVKPLTIAMIVGVLFALWVILGQIGSVKDLVDTLASADWPWVVACVVLTQLTQVSYAFTTIGSVDQKVPLGPAVLMQYAVAFTNMVLPTGAASTLMNIRFLQKQGTGIAVATSSGVLCGISGTVTQFFLFFVTAFLVGQSGAVDDIGGGGDDGKLILVGVMVAAVLLGIAFVVPKLRRFTREKVWPQFANGLRNIWSVLSTPRKLFLVMGGSIGAQVLNSLGLGAALLAYGASLPVGELILVVTGAGFISSLVPVPGGIGVAEASLIAGLTAFGVPPDAASAAVVTYRLFTTYLPPIPGSYATKWLVANGDL